MIQKTKYERTGSDEVGLEELARAILDVVPLVTRSIRSEMRAHRNAELSVPQFRVLSYVRRRGSASLSEVAEHIGLGMPSISTMVDGLVSRGLLGRSIDREDRRKISIVITDEGQKAWAAAFKATCDSMVRELVGLEADERRELLRGLETLRRLFAGACDGNE